MSVVFTCLNNGRAGKHKVKLVDALDVYYQYAANGKTVMARGKCPEHGGNIAIFVSKDKVPSGEKIRAASASHKSKKSRKSKKGSAKRSRNSQKSRKSRK